MYDLSFLVSFCHQLLMTVVKFLDAAHQLLMTVVKFLDAATCI